MSAIFGRTSYQTISESQYKTRSRTLSNAMSVEGIGMGLQGSYKPYSGDKEENSQFPTQCRVKHTKSATIESKNMCVLEREVQPLIKPDCEKYSEDNIPPKKPPRRFLYPKFFHSYKKLSYQRFSNESSETSPNEDVFSSPPPVPKPRKSKQKFFSDDFSKALEDEVFVTIKQNNDCFKSTSSKEEVKYATIIRKDKNRYSQKRYPPVISSPILTPTPITIYPDLLPRHPQQLSTANPDILTDIIKPRQVDLNKVTYRKARSQTLSSSSALSFEQSSTLTRRGSWIFSKWQRRSSYLNQREPIDHSLMTRKFSHGSSDDEDKDRKKKDKDKKKKSKAPSRHGSDAKNADKVRSKLKKFIGRRPTMEMLQEKGIIKENVFNCPLQKLVDKEGTTIPKFIKMCVEEVEKRGLDVDGIYRVSGNLSHVQKLRFIIDQDEPLNLSDSQWEDIHVITGALKMFLRELPEPIIPFNCFDKFINTCVHYQDNPSGKLTTTKQLIKSLPKVNRETLKYLMSHFRRVVEHSSSNRMQVQNIAIVFGPTLLLKPPSDTTHHDPTGSNMAVYMMYQNQIIDYMLTEFDKLFA